MFDARSVKRLVIPLLVLAAGGIAVPSMAQMGGGIERSIVSNAVQNATQSARDQQKGGAASKTAKADTKAKSAPELAGVKSKEARKPSSRAPQQTTRNPSGIPPAGEQRYEPNEVVIEVTSSMTSQQIGALVRRFRLTNLEQVNFQLGGTTLVRLRIPDRRTVTNVVRALETDTGVLFAQPNYLYALIQDKQQAASSGEADPPEYMPAKVRLKEAHQLARGSKVLVAVIDSGIDVTHPDLAGDIVNTFDAIGVGEKVHLHGTAIAGGIAAHGRLLGAAPDAQILAVRAFSGTGRAENGTTFAIMKGLDWSVLNGARIINMSFSGPQDPGVTRGIAAAYARNVIMVAAAGNKGANSPPLFPAADPNVIAVTATDGDDQLPLFANRGPHVAVAAPGVDLILLAPNNAVQKNSGTSFSAAFVTGTVALMLERKPSLTPTAARQALIKSAKRLDPVNDQSGGGLIDAYQALLTVAPLEASETQLTPATNRQ